MTPSPQASIIITSYNYARFLRAAIDSALAQDEADVEVIVVDDGSTDDSRSIIALYGDRITPILKDNAGQASAINVGVAASRGDIVFLLDSDDVILPRAVATVLPRFHERDVVKAHWPMRVIDEHGVVAERLVPQQTLSDGDLRETILRDGPEAYEWPPTSGNGWRRSFLVEVPPIPEQAYRVCPDLYLAALVPLAGTIRRIDMPQSLWRVHGQNNTWQEPFEVRLPRFIWQWDLACDALIAHCRRRGLPADPQRWRHNAWCHRVQRVVEAIVDAVPQGQSFILIDGNEFGAGPQFFSRRCIPFLQRDGQYWGRPADDGAAIDELQRQHRGGTRFVALAWPCFWWIRHYPRFFQYLRERSRQHVANEDVMIFELI